MSVKRFQTRISLKTDTTANWKNSTLQLLKGEFGWDSDLKNFKVGTGVTNESGWNNLMYAIPFFEAGEFTLTDIPASGQGDNAGKTVVTINKVNSSKVIYGTTPTQNTLIGNLAASTGVNPSSNLDLHSILDDFDAKIRAAQASGVQSIGGATGAVTLGNGLTSATGANGSVSTLVNGYIVNNAGTNQNALDIDSSKIDSNYTGSATNLATVGTVSTAIGSLNVSEFALATQDGNAITIHGIKEEDGKISVGTSGVVLADVASTGAAANVSITDTGDNFTATNVEGALAELATGVAGGVNDVTVDGVTVVATVNGKKVAQLLSSDDYSTDNKLATQATVTSAIGALDVDNISGMGADKTIATLTETDGKINATFQEISITHAAVSDWNDNIGVKSVAVGNAGTEQAPDPALQVTTGGSPDDTVSNVLHFTHTPSTTEKVLTSSDLTGIVGAMVYQGTIGDSTATIQTLPAAAAANKGHVYMVQEAGNYAGKACEVGDMIVSNGASWDVINGENQVDNGNPTIVAGAADASTIATVDGTAVTAKVKVTAGSATIASQTGNVVTIKTGVTQTGTTGTIANDSGTDIVLKEVAVTGSASDLSVTEATYGGSTSTTDAQTALTNLASAITNANITIDGHKGTITTGNGLSHVAADNGSFAVQIDTSSANGLSVGENGVAMAKASGSNFGTVEVTAGNGLSISNGVVSYAHNTTAIEVATKNDNTNVVTIKGTLTPDASDNITGSGDITLSAVAVTGDAADVAIEDSGNKFTADTVEGALTELAGKTAGTLNTTNVGGLATNASESLSGTVNLHKISKTGNTDDLIQNLTILLDCGTASTVTDAPGTGDISNDPGNTPADNPGANS